MIGRDLLQDGLTIGKAVLVENMRRRTLHVVAIITLVLIPFYVWGAAQVVEGVGGGLEARGLDVRQLIGVQLSGVAQFGVLFLGAVLGVLLTQGAIRGEAELGTLQAIVARPIGRGTLLMSRWISTSLVCVAYVAVVHVALVVATNRGVGWKPDDLFAATAWLITCIIMLVALTLLASVVLSQAAAGITVFLLFGVGIGSGFIGDIGPALSGTALETATVWIGRLLPFSRAWQASVYGSSGETATESIEAGVGPFAGGIEPAGELVILVVIWLAVVMGAAVLAFRRQDL
jgi:ABC-type transport system involved in multi-copper enzyme maturation permease subunit